MKTKYEVKKAAKPVTSAFIKTALKNNDSVFFKGSYSKCILLKEDIKLESTNNALLFDLVIDNGVCDVDSWADERTPSIGTFNYAQYQIAKNYLILSSPGAAPDVVEGYKTVKARVAASMGGRDLDDYDVQALHIWDTMSRRKDPNLCVSAEIRATPLLGGLHMSQQKTGTMLQAGKVLEDTRHAPLYPSNMDTISPLEWIVYIGGVCEMTFPVVIDSMDEFSALMDMNHYMRAKISNHFSSKKLKKGEFEIRLEGGCSTGYIQDQCPLDSFLEAIHG